MDATRTGRHYLRSLLSVFVALMLVIGSTFFAKNAFAATDEEIKNAPTLSEGAGFEVDPADAKEITLDVTNATPAGFNGSSTPMVVGQEYSMTYPNALKYGGKTLTVKTTVKLTVDGRINENGDPRKWVVTSKLNSENKNESGYPKYKEVPLEDYNKSDDYLLEQYKIAAEDPTGETYAVRTDVSSVNVYEVLDPEASNYATAPKRLAVTWGQASGTKVEWTIETYEDTACTKPYGTVLLTGIQDPDESNYLFSTEGKSIFYVPAPYSSEIDDPPAFGDSFKVTSDGIYTWNPNGNGGEGSNSAMGFTNGLILVSFDGKSTFEFTTDTFNGGYLATPFFYSPIYSVTYELDGGENDPDNPESYMPGDEHTIKPPTKPGYKFVEWKEGDEIKETDTGNKTFTAVWDPIFTITYDANGGQGTMDDQEFMGSDETKMSKDNEFTNPGKTFMGFHAYVIDPETGEETLLVDENGDPIVFESATDMAEYFKDKPGGTSIRMEAQWGVTVTYRDPETGKTYQETVIPEDGEEPEPPADPKRDGYIFKGWKRTVDEYGNIIYEAIWEKKAPMPATLDATPLAAIAGLAGVAGVALAGGFALRKKDDK